jgi:hypothetical protein
LHLKCDILLSSLRFIIQLVPLHRGLKRGELLELARESPQLVELRASALGDTGKFTAHDAELVFAACPSLELFECDMGVKIDSKRTGCTLSEVERRVEGIDPGIIEAELAATLARKEMRARRLKIHSGCAESLRTVAAAAAAAAAVGRVQSLDTSWSLKISDQVGLYKLNSVETHSLKAPGFNP